MSLEADLRFWPKADWRNFRSSAVSDVQPCNPNIGQLTNLEPSPPPPMKARPPGCEVAGAGRTAIIPGRVDGTVWFP